MNYVTIADTETTGIDEGSVCIEIGAILFDVRSATAVRSFSSLIRCGHNEAERVNRIPVTALLGAPEASEVWPVVADMIRQSSAICCHRAEFDKRFIPPEVVGDVPFLCTKFDLTWPREDKPGASLVQLALAHDLGVSHAHRALTDCDLLSRLFTRVTELGADLPALLAKGLRPKATFQACVSFDDRDKAKNASFAWEPTSKRWLRRMAKDDTAALGFPVREVGP